MKKITLEILNIIHDFGYEAYAVGGYVRDMLLNIKSNDIDITTNATPMELKNIFPDINIPKKNYGSVSLIYKNVRFEITTYRKEAQYLDNRHPERIEYVNDLKTDLLRRDFTINAICLDKDDKIIDLLNGQDDLKRGLIKTIGDSEKSFQDDALRILRAVRFATTLNFTLSNEVMMAIKNNKNLLKRLSSDRKKYELDHIFASNRAREGILLLKELDLLNVLEINNIDRIKDYSDIIGIWAMINTDAYNFNSSEKELIVKINTVYELNNLDEHILYKYGLYVNVLAAINKGIDKKYVTEVYQKMPIHDRGDILIDAKTICQLLKKEPGAFISEVFRDLEDKILNRILVNEENSLKKYIVDNYCLIAK